MIWQTGVQMLMTKRPPPIGDEEKATLSREETLLRANAASRAKALARTELLMQRIVRAVAHHHTAVEIGEAIGKTEGHARDLLLRLLKEKRVKRTITGNNVHKWYPK